jgi:hypothetical protein
MRSLNNSAQQPVTSIELQDTADIRAKVRACRRSLFAAIEGGHDRSTSHPSTGNASRRVSRLSRQKGSLAAAGVACGFGCLFASTARVHKAPAMSTRPKTTAVQ